ncbi:MAG: glycosyltransferase [Sneathiella sp.]
MKLPFLSPLRQSPLLRFVPRNARKIAIIGADGERYGRNFRALNPSCHISVHTDISQFEASCFLEHEPGVFDCILMQKTELPQLEAFLTSVHSFLLPDGIVTLCVDNPLHLAQLKEGADGDPHEKRKILKKIASQASQFRSDVRDKIGGAGFHIDCLLSAAISDEVFARWQKEQGVDGLHAGDGLQSLWSFIRTPFFHYRLTMREFSKIHFHANILKPVGGVNDVRIHEPMEALASLPGVTVKVAEEARLSSNLTGVNKVFLWHRPVLTWKKSLPTIQALRSAGYLIVTEFDDHYSPWPSIAENQFLSFAGVHAVQTTKPELATLFSKFNPEVAVFPNQMSEVMPRKPSENSEQTRIFFGALNRQSDWKDLIGPLNKALKTARGDFCFEVVFDKEFYDALETRHKHFTPQCPYGLYKSKLLEADISLMPLLSNEFNQMKSDLKFVEAAGCGAIPVASDVVYGKCDPSDEFSITCKTPEAYADAIISLINDPSRRAAMQKKAREYVKSSRLLCHHVGARYAWYQDLLNRRVELDQALERRLDILKLGAR